jgi:N-acetyl-anhydromuramyl-L-alanine amidase AmpD
MFENRLIYQERLGSGPKKTDKVAGLVQAGDALCSQSCEARTTMSQEVSPLLLCNEAFSFETVEKAKSHLREALAFIKSKVSVKKLKYLNIDFNNPERYLPLMIKESDLDPEAVSRSKAQGYFQMKGIAVKDVKKFFPATKSLKIGEGAANNERNNCILGILYFHLSADYRAGLEKYFGDLSEDGKEKLGLMMYNAGFGTVRDLWKELGATNFEEFEEYLAKVVNDQIEIKYSTKEVQDPYYQVCYQQTSAEAWYLRMTKEKKYKKMNAALVVNGNKMGISLGKAAKMLRYVHIIDALGRSNLSEGAADLGEEMAATIPPPNLLGVEVAKKNKLVWSMANNLVKYCHEKKIPGCEDISNYLKVKPIRERLMEAILRYNEEYNPGFNSEEIAVGGKIFIPDHHYIREYFEQSAADSEEEADAAGEMADLPETLETFKKLPVYLDSKLEKAGDQLLSNKFNFDPAKDLIWLRKKLKHTKHPKKRKKTTKVVLHSTITEGSKEVIRAHGAHFVVERDGKIKYLVPMDNAMNHAGRFNHPTHKAIWEGDPKVTYHSIGIEVVAKQSQEWSAAQYLATKKLVYWLGATYSLKKKDVVTHSQVAVDQHHNRGRKSDPIKLNWTKLELPNNFLLLDRELVAGVVAPNLKKIKLEMKKKGTPWYGALESQIAGYVGSMRVRAQPVGKKLWKAVLKKWKERLKKKHSFKKYKVKKGDSLLRIARKQKSTVNKIRRYNELKSDDLGVGQALLIPQRKKKVVKKKKRRRRRKRR